MNKINIGVLLLFAALLQSCLFYKKANQENMGELKNESALKENVAIPDQWIFSKNADTTNFDLSWIKELHTAQLQELINEGIKYNSNILINQEKLNQVELSMDIAGSNLFPSVNAISGSSNNLVSGSQVRGMAVNTNWELDLWGKNKANKMSSVSDYFSSKYINDKVQQTIAGSIAKSYFLNIASAIQIKKVAQYLSITKELEKLYELRQEVGMANAIDISNIKTEIITIESYLEQIKNANVQSKRSIELLLGRYPEGKIEVDGSFLYPKSKLPEVIPLPLLENRPDILARHFQIEKNFYDVQVAKAARLPSLSLNARIGTANTNVSAINGLFNNPLINVGGNMMTPLFNGGTLKKNIEIENSQQKVAVEEYAQTVLNALNEVESSIANINSVEKQLEYNLKTQEAQNENILLTKQQIEIGSNNNFELLLKQRNNLKVSVKETDLILQDRVERINLYLALGAPEF